MGSCTFWSTAAFLATAFPGSAMAGERLISLFDMANVKKGVGAGTAEGCSEKALITGSRVLGNSGSNGGAVALLQSDCHIAVCCSEWAQPAAAAATTSPGRHRLPKGGAFRAGQLRSKWGAVVVDGSDERRSCDLRIDVHRLPRRRTRRRRVSHSQRAPRRVTFTGLSSPESSLRKWAFGSGAFRWRGLRRRCVAGRERRAMRYAGDERRGRFL